MTLSVFRLADEYWAHTGMGFMRLADFFGGEGEMVPRLVGAIDQRLTVSYDEARALLCPAS